MTDKQQAYDDTAIGIAIDEFQGFLERNGYHMRTDSDGAFINEMMADFPTFWWQFKDELGKPNTDKDVDDVLRLFQTMGLAEKNGDAQSAIPMDTVQSSGGIVLLKLALDPAVETAGQGYIEGSFTNPERGLAFEVRNPVGEPLAMAVTEDIPKLEKLLGQLGRKHVPLKLDGTVEDGAFGVTGIHVKNLAGSQISEDQLQFIVDRLLTAPARAAQREELYKPQLTGTSPIDFFLKTAGETLPRNIEHWAAGTLRICNNPNISAEEKRHAQRALEIMLNIRWKSSHFDRIDPIRARQVLDEELYGMDEVKQRVVETIIQINRTHTLPSYGLLLVGPAGTGKSRIAYAVARILGLPWAVLDMSAIRDPEALTGSSRIYVNAKPGRIMEAFMRAGTSNIVYIINELDKAQSAGNNGSAADALLTLLDNLGFTDAYMECSVPTDGVYPIATANEIDKISDPLLSRFVTLEIPGYSSEEKKLIFRDYSFPRALARMGVTGQECTVSDEAAEVIVEDYAREPGCRDLEQIAEHLAAHALYRIESEGIEGISYGPREVRELLGEA